MNQAKLLNSSKKPNTTGQEGMTLIEVLASMIIFMVVTASIYGVLQVAQRSRGAVNNEVQLTKTVRLGLNLIGRDTYNAGYGYPLTSTVLLRDNRIASLLTVPADTNTTRDTVPPIIAGNDLTVNTFNQTPNTRTDQVTFLFKDSSFNLVGTGPAAVSQPLNVTGANVSGVDEVTVTSGNNSSCRVNDIFLIVGSNGNYTLGVATSMSGSDKVRFLNGDVLGFNNNGSTGEFMSVIPASMWRVKMVTYYVTADGILTRREYANVPPPSTATFVDEPLVYGVENFQIAYIMDDGTEVANPSAGPDGIAGTTDDDQTELAAVRQVRVTISARTTELDARGQPVAVTETSTFSTRNLGYEAN
jgi:Tfp pilus assembly protein PilW